MAEKDRQNGTKLELDMTNDIHNYIQGPFFGLKKWRKPLIYKVTEKGTVLQEGQRIFFSYK